MNPLTEERLSEAQALCRRFGVHRLDVFGSAATGSFDPATSDIDFIVEFEDARSSDMFERYFGLKESFEALFGRPVDLVMAGAMRNPYFIESANRSRRPVYASDPASSRLAGVHACGLHSRQDAERTGIYHSAESVHSELQRRLDARRKAVLG
jgi:predicted nucleotidyltransferase